MRKTVSNQNFDEERALYNLCAADVENCVFAGPADGESALKESRDIAVRGCSFSLRYPLWHVDKFSLTRSLLDPSTRAALWYSSGGTITDCRLYGIKAVRECRDITVRGCDIRSDEFGWKSDGIALRDCDLSGEYPFLDSKNIAAENLRLRGKYSFQYAENVTLRDCLLDTKDAFWHAKNVTAENCVITGEYLGWFSDGLTLINCKITGTQPLCYCRNLTLSGCTTEGCDLAFEYSDLRADIIGRIDSVKNPKSGSITADEIGEIIRGGEVIKCDAEIRVGK